MKPTSRVPSISAFICGNVSILVSWNETSGCADLNSRIDEATKPAQAADST